MGWDKNYVTVEVATDADPDSVRESLRENDVLDEWDRVADGVVVVAGVGSVEPARDRLEAVANRVERALLVHVSDSAVTTTGWYYERAGGELPVVDEFVMEGSRGVPVLDYFTREHDIQASF